MMGDMDKILPAVAAAIGGVSKVAKTGRNTHDGYNFAGIDDFLALVNPVCSENGLFVHIDEGEREDFIRKGKFGENPWMRQSFSFTLYHSSGQHMPAVTRTVEVLRNGAQAYGSAQSYALKQFLRGAFLIPTGDKDDADLRPTDDGEVVSAPKRKTRQAEPAERQLPEPEQEPDFGAIRDRITKGIGARKTKQALTAYWAEEKWALSVLKEGDAPKYAEVRAAFANAGAAAHDDKALQAPALADDELPY